MNRNKQVLAGFERSMREILEDIDSGKVPVSVSNFSELHDYVDANCYGGFCEDDCVVDHNTTIEVQNMVDKWIRSGGHRASSDLDEMTLAEYVCSVASDNPSIFKSENNMMAFSIIMKAKKDYQKELRNHFDSSPLCKFPDYAKRCVDKAVRYDLDSDFVNEMRSDFCSEFEMEYVES